MASNQNTPAQATDGAQAPVKKLSVKSLFEEESLKSRVTDILGKRAATFTTSVIQLVNQSKDLAECEPMSVINAAMVAATLDLPLNNNLGLAYVVPYNQNDVGVWAKVAQFQLGYKGFKQLALRTNRFTNINQTDVRLGEIKKRDRLTGFIEFEWIEGETERLATPIIGYVSFFQLTNGFTSVFYMSVEEIEAHALKYSKVYAKTKKGLWYTDKKGMSEKTVTKLNLSKNAPLSVDDKANENLVTALRTDQAVINDFDDLQDGVQYPDTEEAEFSVVDSAGTASQAEAATMDKINGKNAKSEK